MTRDSLYQQLRTHLAYLNLAAAAEALPAALDTATKTKRSHTTFLEALLKIEVDATEQRRHAGRLRFANCPAPWRLDDFDFSAQPGIDEALMRDLASCRYTDDATNVLFIGPPGVGKAMLASRSVTPPSMPATAPTTAQPPTSPPDADAPRSKAAGPPPCDSSAARPC